MKMLDTHKNGKKDMSKKLWTVYMFLVWYDIYFGTAGVPEKA
jgi:asparagine synthase (glutamine-hydrolysing)